MQPLSLGFCLHEYGDFVSFIISMPWRSDDKAQMAFQLTATNYMIMNHNKMAMIIVIIFVHAHSIHELK